MSEKIKKGILAGGLISTGGLFLAKLIGLAYTIPFSYILGSEAYMGMYGGAYRIYSYILQVFTAGMPFAITTIIARYATKGEWQTVLRVKSLSNRIMLICGFVGMLALWALSPVLAPAMTTTKNIPVMMYVLFILGFALLVIPLVSSYRGYLDGVKDLKTYSASQVYEQIIRVGFLLGASFLITSVLHKQSVWALYASVGSTSIAGIATLFYLRKKTRNIQSPVKSLENPPATKDLIKELLLLSLPYFLNAVLGYADDLISSTIIPVGLKDAGIYNSHEIETIVSAFNYAGTKLIAIPLILAPGFTASMIPHLTEDLTRGDYKTLRESMCNVISIVIVIALPVCAFIFYYANPIYDLLFYTKDLELCTSVTRYLVVEGFCSTLSLILTGIMMACNQKRKVIGVSLFSVILKVCFTYLAVSHFGYKGAVGLSVLGFIFVLSYCFITLKRVYDVDLLKIFGVFISAIILTMIALYLSHLVPMTPDSKITLLVYLTITGIIFVGVYGLFALMMQKISRKDA